MTLRLLLVSLALVGCSTGNTSDAPDAGSSDAATDAPALADGANDASSLPDAGAATVVVFTDLMLAGFPHAMDVYLPSNAVRAAVFLHGGGGTKEGGALHELGVRTDDPLQATPVPDTEWLIGSRTAWIFPQGQHLASAAHGATWSNYVMTSGVDDVAFLTALAAALRAGTLDARVPTLSRVYLAGHSNGGMMSARMWCERTTDFDAFGALAGPPSTALLASGAHPCAPIASRPFLAVIGSADTILQTDMNWSGPWAINSCLTGSGGAIVDATLANEEPFLSVRAQAICGAAPGAPTSDAHTTTWTACGGAARLVRVEGADHCVSAQSVPCLHGRLLPSACDNSLDAQAGTRMRDELNQFFAGTEP